MKISACLTSKSEHYCTPPRVIIPTRKLLVPKGSGRTLFDPWSNEFSQIGADSHADGALADGHKVTWSDYDTTFENPPYGEKIEECIETTHHWHVEVGMPGVILLPARTDTKWMQGGTKGSGKNKRIIAGIHRSCDAWVEVKGRLPFWRPIPIYEKDAAPVKKDEEPYYLRKWWPDATDENLPEPFRSIAPGFAIGPEVAGKPGQAAKPQAAPFPSLIGFWADNVGRYGLRSEGAEHPIDVKEFARHFFKFGTLYVRTGEHRGVYHRSGS